jgi:hypothetical protein
VDNGLWIQGTSQPARASEIGEICLVFGSNATSAQEHDVSEVAGFPLFEPSVSWESAQTRLQEEDLSDGLPLVPPTQARMQAMLEGIAAPSEVHGHLAPLFGEVRADAIAYQCVLAGCRPEEFPVVFTAALACLEESFNLLGLLTTTGTPAVALVVHGPICERLALNASSNCLGPGNRANACIGRALSLVILNVAGAKPGIGDMATMGQPAKYGLCFAEGAHANFDSLASRRGLRADTDAITIIGISGTAEVLPIAGAAKAQDVLLPIALAMSSAPAVSGAGRAREAGEQFFLLPPEMADRLEACEWGLDKMQAFLYEKARMLDWHADGEHFALGTTPVAQSAHTIHPIITGGPGVKMTYIPSWSGGTWSVTRAIKQP